MAKGEESTKPQLDNGDSKKRWSHIIEAVKTPLGFFALLGLVLEVGLGVSISFIDKDNQQLAIIGFCVNFLVLAAIVTCMTFLQPKPLLGITTEQTLSISSPEEPTFDKAPPSVKKFWGPFAQAESLIVLGRFLEEHRRLPPVLAARLHYSPVFESSGLIGFGDSMACAELRVTLERFGVGNFPVGWADLIHGDSLSKNLILLGGPDANAISQDFLMRIKPTLRCGIDVAGEIVVHDTISQKTYAPRPIKEHNRTGTDYGIIIRASNPFNHEKQILYVAGCFGYGTWAGVRFLLSDEFQKEKLFAKGKPFECLVETEVVRDAPLNIRLIVLRELDKS